MLIVRAPFRVSFLGGGSDIPIFYRKTGGATLVTAINRHLFLTGRQMYDGTTTLLKYSKSELVMETGKIQHPIFRAALEKYALQGLDIGVSSDIPAGTGLGSSSTFTVALVGLLEEFLGKQISKREAAAIACEIEIDILGEPIGKQDQYSSAVGGMNLLRFHRDDSVDVEPLWLSLDDWSWLDKTMFLVQIPEEARSASAVLNQMKDYVAENNEAKNAIAELAELAVSGFQQIQNSGIKVLPELINRAWELKKMSNPLASPASAESIITRGRSAGAAAAKVLGAGGGGFVLFLVEETNHESFILEFQDNKVLHVKPDIHGLTTIYRGENK